MVRNEKDLRAALDDFAALREENAKARVAGTSAYNMEYGVYLDTLSMLDVSLAAASSALLRDETRGAHTRSDFPEQRDDYGLFNTFLRQGTDGMPVCEKRDVVFSRKTLEQCRSHKKS